MTLNEFTSMVVPTGRLKQDVALEIFTYFGSDYTAKSVKLPHSPKFQFLMTRYCTVSYCMSMSHCFYRKALEMSLKFSTTPRKAVGTDRVVSFYNVPVGNEEMSEKICLNDRIRWGIIDVFKSPHDVYCSGSVFLTLLQIQDRKWSGQTVSHQ